MNPTCDAPPVKENPSGGVSESPPGGPERDPALVSTAYGQNMPLKNHILVYPDGVRAIPAKLPAEPVQPPHLAGVKRGEITTLTKDAAGRLRAFSVEMFVPDALAVAATLTVRDHREPDEWRTIMQRFRNWVNYVGIGGVWRVELQKRGTPHVHVVFWLPQKGRHWHETYNDMAYQIRDAWLRVTRADDYASRDHSCQLKALHNGSGWAVYMALHNSKKNGEQLGWKGKQWGKWNEKLFEKRPAIELTVSDRQKHVFNKILARWLYAQQRMNAHKAVAAARKKGRVKKYKKPKLWRINDDNGYLMCVPQNIIADLSRAIPDPHTIHVNHRE